jgi:hypothetical protein
MPATDKVMSRDEQLKDEAARRLADVKRNRGRSKPLTPAEMREKSLEQNKAIRKWGEERKIGTRSSSFSPAT